MTPGLCQVPEASPRLEGVAGLPGPEENHRRVQRVLPPAGTDDQPRHDESPLEEDH